MSVCIRTPIHRCLASFRIPPLLQVVAVVVMGWASLPQAFAADQVDRVFGDGFEPALISGGNDIDLEALASIDLTCPEDGRQVIQTRPGDPVRFCYRLENDSDVTLDWQEVSSSTYGLIYQGPMSIAPGESVLIEDSSSPHTFEHRTQDQVVWKTSGGGRYGKASAVVDVKVAPSIVLYRFLTTDAANCQEGIDTSLFPPAVSGYTALTVASGAQVTHCFRARNGAFGDSNVLTDNVLVDSLFGALLDSAQSFSNGQVYTVAAQQVAATNMELGAQWSASDGVDTVSSEAQSSLYVSADPACDGIRQSTTYDYVFDFSSFLLLANIRLDFDVSASPAVAGESITVDAHGAISSLIPDEAFGPRHDTRVFLPIPAGIDLSRPIQAQASINDGVPISANFDIPGRMLVLSTGPVVGAPAEINLHVVAYVTAGQTQTVSWAAPSIEFSFEGDNGSVFGSTILPDPLGPPVLATPICVSP